MFKTNIYFRMIGNIYVLPLLFNITARIRSLWEGNILSPVCQSVQGGPDMITTHDAIAQSHEPPLPHGPVQTYSFGTSLHMNWFKLVPLEQFNIPSPHNVVYILNNIGQQAVGLRLKAFCLLLLTLDAEVLLD